MNEIKNILRYPGGKSRAIPFLMEYIPVFSEYREPFVGGASIFLAVKQKYPNKKYIINDLYRETYNFWIVCQERPLELVNKIKEYKSEYKDKSDKGEELFKFLYRNMRSYGYIERAAAFFILNRSSFSGMMSGFSEDAFKNRFTDSSIESIKELGKSEILKDVQIYNKDYQEILEIDNIDNSKKIKESDILIICDPPYWNVGSPKLYGRSGALHKFFDHQRFANVMKNMNETKKYNWIITYDNSNKVKQLFNWAPSFVEFDLVYGMGNTKSIKNTSGKTKLGKELLISNMDLESVKIKNTKQRTIDNAWD